MARTRTKQFSKQPSVGPWPKDWRKRLGDADEKLIPHIMALGRMYEGLSSLNHLNHRNISAEDLRGAAIDSLNEVLQLLWTNNTSDPGFALHWLRYALEDGNCGRRVEWLKKGGRGAPTRPAIQRCRGKCAALMEVLIRNDWSRERAGTFITMNTPFEAWGWFSKGQFRTGAGRHLRWEAIDDWREECLGVIETESPQYISYQEELNIWTGNQSARSPDSSILSIEQWVRDRLDEISVLIPPLIARN